MNKSTRLIALAILAFSAACSKADKSITTPPDTTVTPPPPPPPPPTDTLHPPPPPPPPPVDSGSAIIMAAGNIARCQNGDPTKSSNGNDIRTAALVDSVPTATVITLGNAANPAGVSQNYSGCYHANWGRFRSRTFPVPGSHDYDSTGLANAADYFAYFGGNAGTPGEGWRSMDVGSWHVVLLNTENKLQGANFYNSGSAQQAWLESDLTAASAKKCTIVAFARPRFYSSSTGGAERTTLKSLWDRFEAHGVDVVLNGGAYQYERMRPMTSAGVDDPNGIRQFIAGMGGESANPVPSASPHSEKLLTVFGVLKLTLRATTYDWAYIGADGSILDSGTGSCH